MAARFNVKKRGSSKGSQKGLRNSEGLNGYTGFSAYLYVNPEYWTEHRQVPFTIYDTGCQGKKDMTPGEYLVTSEIPVVNARQYNPIVEAPKLFLEFCKIGGKPFDKSAILDFTRKYGMLQNYIYSRGDEQPRFYVYSLQEFHYKAWVAYQVFNLFIALGKRDRGNVLKHITEIDEKAGWGLAEKFSHILYTRYFDSIPEDYRIIAKDIETITSDDVADGFWPDHDEKALLYKALADDAFPAEPFFRLAQEAIFWPVNLYIGALRPYVALEPVDNKQGKFFSPFWAADSLLSAVWFQFYIKITGQSETVYKVCSVCGEPIENPGRKDREYHQGCRQIAHNRKVRQTVKLWKDGRTYSEIAAITGAKPEMIKKWIDKEAKKQPSPVKD